MYLPISYINLGWCVGKANNVVGVMLQVSGPLWIYLTNFLRKDVKIYNYSGS